MTLKELQAIAEGKAELPVERVDVRVPDDPRQGTLIDAPPAAPLMRHLIRVEFRMYGGQRWIYWYWTPEPPKAGEDLGGLDCGYSGRRFPEGA